MTGIIIQDTERVHVPMFRFVKSLGIAVFLSLLGECSITIFQHVKVLKKFNENHIFPSP